MPSGVHNKLKDGLRKDSSISAQASAYTTKEHKTDKKISHRPWWRLIVEIYLFIPLAIMALEGLFNLAGIGQGEIVMPDLKLGCKHIANKMVTWRLEGYSHGKLNSAGMRDEEHSLSKPPGVTRLAFLGDSYTEGLQVPMQDTFASRILPLLNSKSNGQKYETLNFGCSSFSSGQELLLFQNQVAAYKPDIVVLLYTPGDTSENSVTPAKRATAEGRPYFYLDQDQKLQEDDGVLSLNYEKLRPRPMRDFLRAHSTIYGAYCQTSMSLSMSDKVYFRACRLVSQIGEKMSALFSEKMRVSAAIHGPINPSGTISGEPDKLAISEAIIAKLNDDVKACGGKLIVMAFPDIGKGDPLYISTRSHLAALAKKDNFGYLDLSDSFSIDKNPNNLFLKVHFSQLGHDLTARQLSVYLHSTGNVPQQN